MSMKAWKSRLHCEGLKLGLKVPSLNDGNIGSMFWILLQVIGGKSTCYSTATSTTPPQYCGLSRQSNNVFSLSVMCTCVSSIHSFLVPKNFSSFILTIRYRTPKISVACFFFLDVVYKKTVFGICSIKP
jgi:hypothetical protein